jgi:hypothetical protein
MMMGGMFFGGLLAIFLVLGFSYIVWVLALKEAGWIKTTGIVIACGIAILALLMFLYSGIYGGRVMGPGMM